MLVYLDNVIASGKVIADLKPKMEMRAVRTLEKLQSVGKLRLVTSREAWREQERTRDATKRAQFRRARGAVAAIQDDHQVVGFAVAQDELGGYIASPLVTDITDEALFADLKALGLKDADARHLMYAARNGCDRFITLDPDFLTRRSLLEARCGTIRIAKPSELVAELTSSTP